jgi:hypothetical protein
LPHPANIDADARKTRRERDMKTEYLDRIRCAQLRDRVTRADNAAR